MAKIYRIVTVERTVYEYLVEMDEDTFENAYDAIEGAEAKEIDHDCEVVTVTYIGEE